MAEIEKQNEGPGKLLKAARKAAGLSIEDIAGRLNLSKEMIGNLESDNYEVDFPDAFIRGYLRTYARALEQDEEQVIALFSQSIGSTIVRNYYIPSADVAPVKLQIGSHLLWFKILSIVVVIVILALGWIAYSQTDDKNTATKTLSVPLSKNQPDADIETGNELVSMVEITNNEPQTVDDSQPAKIESYSLVEQVIETPILNNAELDFTFIDDCWVQVIDSNEEVLAVGLKTAGRRFTVSGVPPITVVVGKPRAISLQYNNQAVDLTIYPASQTARFILGEE